MSNGDDVLDNWEEIDEEELTSTLVKLQSDRKTQESKTALQTPPSVVVVSADANSFSSSLVNIDYPSPMKLLQRNSTAQADNVSPSVVTSPLDSMAASFQPVMMVLHKANDEYQSVNYEQPISTQTVKILRRPTQSTEPRNNGNRSRQPIKTLQQREQEYAEARLRIMGAAKNPEDDVAAAIDANNVTTPSTTTTTIGAVTEPAKLITTPPKSQNFVQNNYHSLFQQQQQQQQQTIYYQQLQTSPAYNNRTALFSPPLIPPLQSWSPIVGGSVSQSASALMAPYAAANASATAVHQQLQPLAQQQHHNQDSILRMPRGPEENTLGFQPRR